MDDRYRHSETYRRAISADELRSVFCCLITNVGCVLWQSQLPVPRLRGRIAVCLFLICTAILQYGWYRLVPSSFLRCRTGIRIFNRLVRSSLFVWIPWSIRTGINAVGVRPHIHNSVFELSMHSSAGAYLLWIAVKHLLMISGTTVHMIMAVHTTLPPRGQLALHAVNTLVHISSHTAATVLIMRSTPYAAVFNTMCNALNVPLVLTQVDLENSISVNAHLDRSCHEHAVELLVLFVMLYGGLVLPVYLAVRIDGHRQRQFLLEMQLQRSMAAPGSSQHDEAEDKRGLLLDSEGLPMPEHDDDGLLCVALFDISMALLLAVGTWGVLVHCRGWLWMVVVPL